MGTACRRRTFPTVHVTQAEVLEREQLLRMRNSGTLPLSDRLRLKTLMRYAVNPPDAPPYCDPPERA